MKREKSVGRTAKLHHKPQTNCLALGGPSYAPPFLNSRPMPLRLLLSATTDLTYDQRMQRASTALAAAGYEVLLIGRELPTSQLLDPTRPYRQHRLRCRFHHGKLFYLEFNLRLLFFLLRQPRAAAYCAVDLDTIMPVWLAARLRRRPWTYDAHELFTEVPEVVARPGIRRLWQWVEAFAVPRATRAYTVGPALAEVFRQRYGKPFGVVRNVPAGGERTEVSSEKSAVSGQRSEADGQNNLAPPSSNLILYQGALNVGRGLEQLLDAMPLIDASARLIICGEGDLSAALRGRVAADPSLRERVEFKGYVVPAELRRLTAQATVGTMLLENKGLSYYYSLANKFFDYVQAQVPQVCIDFPEYRALNQEFEVAVLVADLAPQTLALAINRLLTDAAHRARLRTNCARAAPVWSWDREQAVLVGIYREMLGAS